MNITSQQLSTLKYSSTSYDMHMPSDSDVVKSAHGFQAVVSVRCGGILYADSKQKSITYKYGHTNDTSDVCIVKILKTNETDDGKKIFVGVESSPRIEGSDKAPRFSYTCHCTGPEGNFDGKSTSYDEATTTGFLTSSCDHVMEIEANLNHHDMVITYSTVGDMCEEIGDKPRGTYRLGDNRDCEFTLETTPGNYISLDIV